MESLQLREIASVLGSPDFTGDGKITAVSTDSRTVREDEVFFAIKGERLDGHDYVSSALQNGAPAAVVSEVRPEWPKEKLIPVPDTTEALLTLGTWYRNRFSVRAAAVTGSVGKTTSKDMIAAVLSSDGPTMKTQGNQNNEIGLPKTLLSISSKDRYAVIEMGMTDLHQITPLSQAVRPEVGVITNIGVSHLETLGTRENILRAKLEICDGIANGGVLLINGDNDLLKTVSVPRLRVLTYGKDEKADFRIMDFREETDRTTLTLCWQGREYEAMIPCIGEHNVYNAAAAFGVGVSMGIAPEKLIPALANYEPSGMRQRMVQFRDMLVIEDCYNAAPDSMRAALSTLRKMGTGRKIAVLADMLELGSVSETSHAELGDEAKANGVEILYCYGPRTEITVAAARKAGVPAALHFDTKDALTDALLQETRPGDTILFKGSRSMALEDVLRRFYAEKC